MYIRRDGIGVPLSACATHRSRAGPDLSFKEKGGGDFRPNELTGRRVAVTNKSDTGGAMATRNRSEKVTATHGKRF